MEVSLFHTLKRDSQDSEYREVDRECRLAFYLFEKEISNSQSDKMANADVWTLPISSPSLLLSDPETKELDADLLRSYIFGGHVSEFMESLEEEDDERFKKHFSSYLADDVGSDDIEEIYENAHSAIREDPSFKPSDKTSKDWAAESKKYKATKLTYEQRKAKIQEKIAAFNAGS